MVHLLLEENPHQESAPQHPSYQRVCSADNAIEGIHPRHDRGWQYPSRPGPTHGDRSHLRPKRRNTLMPILYYFGMSGTGNWFFRGTNVRVYRKEILIERSM